MNATIEQERTLPIKYRFVFAGRKWPWALAACSLLLFGITFVLDAKKPFWNDELFTFYISRQPSMHAVWKVLMTGAEQLPPFFFSITRVFNALLGTSPVAFRMPETLGFLVMALSVFAFVRSRVPTGYALLAFIFPALTDAYDYAYEARPYGLVMGLTGLAMLCWRAAAGHRHRLLSLSGLAICLACALSCHYYAILLLFPFCLAELVRLWERKQPDVLMYGAILVSTAPLIVFSPLIRAASKYSSHFWSKPIWTWVLSFYEKLLLPSAFALVLIVIAAGAFTYARRRIAQPPIAIKIPPYELALVLGFSFIPIIAIALGKFVTGAFNARYSIYAIIGIAILLGWSTALLGKLRAATGTLMAAAAFACWIIIDVRLYQKFAADGAAQAKTFEILNAADPTTPVVIASPHMFFEQSHRAALLHRGHFIYLADVDRAIEYTGTDTVERGLLTLRNYAPLDVRDFHDFTATHSQFFVFGFPRPFSWLMQELMREGRVITAEAIDGETVLYLVRGPTH